MTPDWRFLLKWVLVTSLELWLALPAAGLLMKAVPGLGGWGSAAIFPLMGLFLGLSQWLLLRSRLPSTSGWIFATAVGMVVGVVVGFMLTLPAELLWPTGTKLAIWLILGLGLGLGTGSGQFVVIKYMVKHARWWIATSGIAFMMYVGMAMSAQNLLLVVMGSICYAAITGFMIDWLSGPCRKQHQPTA